MLLLFQEGTTVSLRPIPTVHRKPPRASVGGFTIIDNQVGFIALPNVWIFQILFPLISPVMDLMVVYTLLVAGLDRLQQPVNYSSTALRQVLFYYALFLTIDWVAAGFYVMIKSVAVAARGSTVGWGKLDRKATAEAQP